MAPPLVDVRFDGARAPRQSGSVGIERRRNHSRSDMIPMTRLRGIAGGGCPRREEQRPGGNGKQGCSNRPDHERRLHGASSGPLGRGAVRQGFGMHEDREEVLHQ